ncbi:transcriptional regulator NrdR [Candidatus Providencia siddallii]|uniref:Transcriptional repressor NrdR n=1 Tax=Candidatus Providencia siddallii TaxID=1715285 RepID=A0ABM9NPD3_9GAMM
MRCPFCFAINTKVINSRLFCSETKVRRRRKCQICNERFTTFEIIELIMPRIIKNDKIREPFDEKKLSISMLKALEKRNIDLYSIESAISNIKNQLRSIGEREVKSKFIGKLVMNELKKIDKVAYIRFVSVYRSFKDVNEFWEEIDKLECNK